MPYSSLFAILLSIICIIYFGYGHTYEQTIALIILQGVVLSMIIFDRFWAKYIITRGFMAARAKDYKQAEFSAPAVAMLGWIGLIILSYIGFL